MPESPSNSPTTDLNPQARLERAKEQALQGWIGNFEEDRTQVCRAAELIRNSTKCTTGRTLAT